MSPIKDNDLNAHNDLNDNNVPNELNRFHFSYHIVSLEIVKQVLCPRNHKIIFTGEDKITLTYNRRKQ